MGAKMEILTVALHALKFALETEVVLLWAVLVVELALRTIQVLELRLTGNRIVGVTNM